MSKLEDLQPNAAVRGILPDALVDNGNTSGVRSNRENAIG